MTLPLLHAALWAGSERRQAWSGFISFFLRKAAAITFYVYSHRPTFNLLSVFYIVLYRLSNYRLLVFLPFGKFRAERFTQPWAVPLCLLAANRDNSATLKKIL
jgi:hypothetical protein